MMKPRGPQPAAFKKQNIEGLSVRRLINFCEDAASEVSLKVTASFPKPSIVPIAA